LTYGDHRPRRDRRRDSLEHAGRDQDRLRLSRRRGRAFCDVHRIEGPLRADRLAHEKRPFDQERLLFVARATITSKPPQTLDLRMMRAEWGQEAC
jgi:hypothetical protein